MKDVSRFVSPEPPAPLPAVMVGIDGNRYAPVENTLALTVPMWELVWDESAQVVRAMTPAERAARAAKEANRAARRALVDHALALIDWATGQALLLTATQRAALVTAVKSTLGNIRTAVQAGAPYPAPSAFPYPASSTDSTAIDDLRATLRALRESE